MHEVVNKVRGFAVSSDLEKYYDIYDIGRGIPILKHRPRRSVSSTTDCASPVLQRAGTYVDVFRGSVRLLLCTLLALNIDRYGSDGAKWSAVEQHMDSITTSIGQILPELRSCVIDQTGARTWSECYFRCKLINTR